MTLVNIDIKNIASETHPDDRVVFYSPTFREAPGGGITSTAETVVSLVDGVGEIELVPGPVTATFQCRGISDTRPKSGTVPDAGPVDIADVIGESFTYTPPITNDALNKITMARDNALAQVEASMDDAGIARVSQGKNLYNPTEDAIGFYIAGAGAIVPIGDLATLSGYRTTDYIRVEPGEQYALSTARHWAFYDADRAYIAGSWEQSQPQAATVVAAPEGARYLRMSYSAGLTPPSTVQIEHGGAHTAYEPWQKTLDESITIPEIADITSQISSRPTTPEVQNIVNTTVEDATADVARVIPGKNLYNPDTDDVDVYINNYTVAALAGYRTTDFIPVVAGESYALSVMRHLHFYDSDKNAVQGGWSQKNPPVPTVVTAPPGSAYMRMSYPVSAAPPSTVQIEHGDTHTDYEPWQKVLDPSIAVQAAPVAGGAPTQVSRSGDVVTVISDLGGQPITQDITLGMGRNSVMNFSRVQYGEMVQTLNDDVAPIRTQQGTVGANHGLAGISRWPVGTHDKTLQDVGSQWTDGVNDYAILLVDDAGNLWVGRKPTVNAAGEAIVHSANPTSDLTHVSGATNTTAITTSGRVADQFAPWVQRRRQTIKLDGVDVDEGMSRGYILSISESYEILDYGQLWDWVTTHIGTSYTSVHQRAAVGVETSWEFHPGGKLRHRTALWEISPTRLGNCGFMQAIALPGTVTRYLPGVGVVGGFDWDQGVDLSLLTSNLKVASDDLLNGVPPTMAVDVRSDIGLAIALSPWVGESESAKHLAATPSNLWDLRNTKKIYPNITGTLMPGWGRVEVEGIRAYLTPEEATSVVADADPLSAWVTLNQMVRQ